MSTAAASHSHPHPPTEDAPERGVLTMFDIDLSEADYFVVDGDHVIRSREFDVIAGGASFGEALRDFSTKILDFAIYLGEISEAAHLAENEEAMFHVLAPRVMRIIRAIERHDEEQKRRRRHVFGLSIGRLRSEEDGPEWHQSSRHGGSSVPSLA